MPSRAPLVQRTRVLEPSNRSPRDETALPDQTAALELVSAFLPKNLLVPGRSAILFGRLGLTFDGASNAALTVSTAEPAKNANLEVEWAPS